MTAPLLTGEENNIILSEEEGLAEQSKKGSYQFRALWRKMGSL